MIRIMRIALVHNAVGKNSREDDLDVLEQVTAVSGAITELGHWPVVLECTLDLNAIKDQLQSVAPDLVFNLVESLSCDGRLIHLFPALLDSMGIPYTGSVSEAVYVTSHKILAKEWMVVAGIPTPKWWGPQPINGPLLSRSDLPQLSDRWLVKSVWEHASLGLDSDEPINNVTGERLTQILRKRAPGLGKCCFAEIYVPGREFNLSILSGSHGSEVLPPAEILFENFEQGMLPIVGYKAKWDKNSYEYHHTPRRFDFPPADDVLLANLKKIAIRCWELFGLNGYGRVDFRVDENNHPWVLEVNSNPCISPDAGFTAAISQAGLSYQEAVSRIISASAAKAVEP